MIKGGATSMCIRVRVQMYTYGLCLIYVSGFTWVMFEILYTGQEFRTHTSDDSTRHLLTICIWWRLTVNKSSGSNRWWVVFGIILIASPTWCVINNSSSFSCNIIIIHDHVTILRHINLSKMYQNNQLISTLKIAKATLNKLFAPS